MDTKRRAIPGFEDYSITNDGRVFSHKSDLWLKPLVDANGYHMVTFWKNGKSTLKKVHRLVLEVFDRTPALGEVCRHLNGNPQDNRLDNLRWGTVQENAIDCIYHGTGANKLEPECVIGIRVLAHLGWNLHDLARISETTYQNIHSIVKRKSWKHVKEPYLQ